MKISIVLFFTLISSWCLAQNYDPNHLPFTYNQSDNPNYWKNKIPKPGYWQQDIYYEIEAVINDSTDIIHGNQFKLTYWNNSPDTLSQLYFHLYQNAFQPHSHMHDLYENNEKEVSFGLYENIGLGTECENIKVNGIKVKSETDNTILRVQLNSPLKPNTSITIEMTFKTYFDKGGLRRRMKTFSSSGEKHYDGVHWYPSICVYDSKFKWTTEQHLDKEFYSNFGAFNIKLTFPEKYIVDATGSLQNKNEVMPASLDSLISLDNFKSKGNQIDKNLLYDTTQTLYKTWHFYAENVHNFAFTADPNYRKKTIEWNNVKIVTLAQEKNAHLWQPSGEFTKKVIQTYSNDFGTYIWPKIIIADANDGMEYPMLTLDGGSYPRHQSLLAHEVGHMWFYGMVGSNETYRAFLDEGFTQFLTVWSMDKITGEETPSTPDKPYISKHKMPKRTKYSRLYYPYTVYQSKGYDYPLNTHSSDFRGAVRHGGGYGLVYFKTGVMLYNLQYVLGDSLFQKAIQHYFQTWKCAHPYPEDFRQSITNYTGVDLNWFFDAWLETTKSIDYSIEKVKTKNDSLLITFKRKGDLQMPIDFRINYTDSTSQDYHIPNTWFTKNTNSTVLPKWYGWGNLHPSYTCTLKSDKKIKSIEIDPSKNLADVNLSNNTYRVNKIKLDNGVKNPPNWYEPKNTWRPDLGYTKLDGLQIGLTFSGNYMKHLYEYKASILYNTQLGQYNINKEQESANSTISWDLYAKQALNNKRLYLLETFKHYGGVWLGQIGIEKTFQKQDLRYAKKQTLSLKTTYLQGPKDNQFNYPFYKDLWSYSSLNSFFDIGFNHSNTKKNWELDIRMRSNFIYSDFKYSYLEVEPNKTIKGNKLDLKIRGFLRLGTGNTPIESGLLTAGANSEELYGSRITSADGIIPSNLTQFNNQNTAFHQNGGLNLRGYAGLTINEGQNNESLIIGKNGISTSLELNFERFLGIQSNTFGRTLSLQSYFFADAGIIQTESLENITNINPILADFGIGLAFVFDSPYYNINKTVVTAEFPLLLSHPGQNNSPLQVRYLIGIKTDL